MGNLIPTKNSNRMTIKREGRGPYEKNLSDWRNSEGPIGCDYIGPFSVLPSTRQSRTLKGQG